MSAGTSFARTGAWGQAAGRVLLFLVLFLGLLVAGSPLAMGDQETMQFLALSSLVMLAAGLGAGAIVVTRLDRRRVGALGFAWTAASRREIAIGLAIGVGSIALVAGGLALVGKIGFGRQDGTVTAWATTVVTHLGILGVAAAAEEVLFRGYAFQAVSQAMGPITAVLATSLVFALAHRSNPGADGIALLNIFLAGVLLGAAYLRTRSLWFATAVHLGWNWGMASLLDLPVSGLTMFDTPLYEPTVGGSDWLTGGDFGPEGGLAGTLAFALALLAVLRWPRLDEAPAMRTLRPLVDTEEA